MPPELSACLTAWLHRDEGTGIPVVVLRVRSLPRKMRFEAFSAWYVGVYDAMLAAQTVFALDFDLQGVTFPSHMGRRMQRTLNFVLDMSTLTQMLKPRTVHQVVGSVIVLPADGPATKLTMAIRTVVERGDDLAEAPRFLTGDRAEASEWMRRRLVAFVAAAAAAPSITCLHLPHASLVESRRGVRRLRRRWKAEAERRHVQAAEVEALAVMAGRGGEGAGAGAGSGAGSQP